MDSLLPVKSLKLGVSIDMKGYTMVKKIHNLMKMHKDVRVVHSYREENACANTLVKERINSLHQIVFRDEASNFINSLIERDTRGTVFPSMVR